MAKYYITTAIDYVNSRPHIGHAYEKILADFLARWHRQRGDDTFYLTGTDENAEKNEQAAKEVGIPVKEFVDNNSKIFEELCKKLNLSNDFFIRTTTPKHFDVSKDIFKKVFDKGDIYKGTYEGFYCIGCEEFLTETQLVGGKCPEHNKVPQLLKEDSYFFKMSKYEKQIIKLLETKGFVQPEHWRNEVLARVKQDGLKDISVSRVDRDWGIPVPIDDKHKIYVWFDALINYLSGIDYPDGETFKKFWPANAHVIGKGINWFHSVIWPSMLLSAGIKVPESVLVHGYITLDGKKMSKSSGATVDPIALVDDYGADALRYYLLREIPFGADGDFTEQGLITRYNNELANDLGNLVKRITTLVGRSFAGNLSKSGKDALQLQKELTKADVLIDSNDLNGAIDIVWKSLVSINVYITKEEPWKITDEEKLKEVLYNVLEGIRFVCSYLYPLIPQSVDTIRRQLGFELLPFFKLKWGEANYAITASDVLFPKIELKEEEKFLANLKVGKIIGAEEHPDADKLMVLQVDLGAEKRQIVAGVRGHYAKDELLGKHIVVVSNLKFAKLRGKESQGMLLAASDPDDKKIVLVSASKSKPGDVVQAGPLKNNTDQITIDEFFDTIKLVVKDHKVVANGVVLKSEVEELSINGEDG